MSKERIDGKLPIDFWRDWCRDFGKVVAEGPLPSNDVEPTDAEPVEAGGENEGSF